MNGHYTKFSVSIPTDLCEKMDAVKGYGGRSGFISRAVADKIKPPTTAAVPAADTRLAKLIAVEVVKLLSETRSVERTRTRARAKRPGRR